MPEKAVLWGEEVMLDLPNLYRQEIANCFDFDISWRTFDNHFSDLYSQSAVSDASTCGLIYIILGHFKAMTGRRSHSLKKLNLDQHMASYELFSAEMFETLEENFFYVLSSLLLGSYGRVWVKQIWAAEMRASTDNLGTGPRDQFCVDPDSSQNASSYHYHVSTEGDS